MFKPKFPDKNEIVGLLIIAMLVTFIYLGLDIWILKLAAIIPQENLIGKSSIIFTFFSLHPKVLLLFLFLSPVLLSLKSYTWNALEFPGALKFLIVFCTGLLVWILGFESFDYFYDSWFLFDRIILVGLLILVFLHPAFILLFVVSATIFYAHYFSVFDWTYSYDIKPLFNILCIAILVPMLRFRIFKLKYLYWLIFASVLSSYFFSGLGKLLISPNGYEWVFDNELFLLPLNAQLRGWNLSEIYGLNAILSLTLKKGAILFSLSIFVIEILCVFALANKRLLKGLLIGLTLMHICIGLMLGLFFWVWVIVDLALLVQLRGLSEEVFLFNGKLKYFKSIVVVLFCLFVFRPFSFAWFDSRMQWYTTIEVLDEQDNIYYMDKNNFGGYSYMFAHDYMHPVIPFEITGFNGYAGNYEEVKAYRINRLEELSEILKKTKRTHFETKAKSTLAIFLKTYLNNYNRNVNVLGVGKYKAPRQLYMYNPDLQELPKGVKVVKAQMRYKEFYYFKDDYITLIDTVILNVDLQ